jgi:transcriptional regulator with XRE-family HTH domain
MINRTRKYSAKFFWDGFGDRLVKAIRSQYGSRGMAEYCRQTGLSRRTVENYIAGISVPDLKMLSEILGGLNCDPVWLTFGDADLSGLVSEQAISYTAAAALDEAERRLAESLEALQRARRELDEGKG